MIIILMSTVSALSKPSSRPCYLPPRCRLMKLRRTPAYEGRRGAPAFFSSTHLRLSLPAELHTFIPSLRATSWKALCLQIYLKGMSVSHSYAMRRAWDRETEGRRDDRTHRRKHLNPEILTQNVSRFDAISFAALLSHAD